ncbi:MAG: hypothetical protein AUH91_02860 [Verrucomicrobia bacterium 13_1_40CM_4_54_4]|nr:MAG: hypothetical protein AUH91_02860 [Verrucomicrobia bacterium 13_1_40CM_4_54_4]
MRVLREAVVVGTLDPSNEAELIAADPARPLLMTDINNRLANSLKTCSQIGFSAGPQTNLKTCVRERCVYQAQPKPIP